MPKPNFFARIAVTVFVAVVCNVSVFAQTETKSPIEPSYEVTLQVIAAAKNAGEKTPVPSVLSSVVKKLKDNYPNTNYYLSSTFLQRIANNGNFDFRGVSPASNQNQDISAPTFAEWKLDQFSTALDPKGTNAFQLRNFRFGLRIPLKTANPVDANGKSSSTINYEPFWLSVQKINLAENSPTVIGNISGSDDGEVMFLVLTVKAAQN